MQLNRRDFLKCCIVTAGLLGRSSSKLRRAYAEDNIEEKILEYNISNGTINLRLLQKPGSDITYFIMHDNENTAAQAAETIVHNYGGRLIELIHKNTRNIAFQMEGQRYEFDPNRIFSDEGIILTLKEYGKVNVNAIAEVKRFRKWLLNQLTNSKILVTVHNNRNDDGKDNGLSILSYKSRTNAAERVHVVKDRDPDDFFYVTIKQHFTQLASQNYNVVLQDNQKIKDNGSLSIYWARQVKTSYINVEAQHGHLEEQVSMLKTVVKLFSDNPQRKQNHNKYEAL